MGSIKFQTDILAVKCEQGPILDSPLPTAKYCHATIIHFTFEPLQKKKKKKKHSTTGVVNTVYPINSGLLSQTDIRKYISALF